ncbi:MAG: peptide-methionine (S)-S-oxide reductase MsrA [Verrucomicrobia bacterium]|nr:peptide-methionine (S)-S-oxide reductase MsrA [Verrucomicrobiota bacterium]
MKPMLYTLLVLGALTLRAAEPAKVMTPETNKTERATLGGGCFWCVEATLELLPGVKNVLSGYAGGHKEDPTYEEVITKTTGHAEVVQVEFDPAVISYEKLLEAFWEVHDPTTLNRQGNDVGPQYRSIILYHNDAQKLAAERSKAAEQKKLSRPIVTEIVPLKKFYEAEAYHQDYFRRNPNQAYCQVVIRPKVNKLEKKLKEQKR